MSEIDEPSDRPMNIMDEFYRIAVDAGYSGAVVDSDNLTKEEMLDVLAFVTKRFEEAQISGRDVLGPTQVEKYLDRTLEKLPERFQVGLPPLSL